MNDGTAFEREVRDLLSLVGDATGELQPRHKKVDILLEQTRFGQPVRIAVECKSHSKRLDLSEVSAMHAEYQALIEARLVDEVLLVTRSGLTPADTSG
jgi:hypothetical protein